MHVGLSKGPVEVDPVDLALVKIKNVSIKNIPTTKKKERYFLLLIDVMSVIVVPSTFEDFTKSTKTCPCMF